MPFAKGNQLGKANKGRKKEQPKTIWLLQSLAANGVNLEEMLAKALLKAARGDRQATDLAHLLAKMLPHVANAPKQDVGINQIETLVINRFEAVKEPVRIDAPIEAEIESSTDGQPSNNA